MGNIAIYEAVREVPQNAQKPIAAGRLKGKTDINPMWRIKVLTEQFGPCGFGWKYVITKQWIEEGNAGEIAAFCNIDLFVKHNGEWSEAIPGTGGSAFVASESRGLYTSDECYKMALTDAISVACKALGFGADIYWQADRTKYDQPHEPVQRSAAKPQPQQPVPQELLPLGPRFVKAVELHAHGKMAGKQTVREKWISEAHATADMIEKFDFAVEQYKVNNNLQ